MEGVIGHWTLQIVDAFISPDEVYESGQFYCKEVIQEYTYDVLNVWNPTNTHQIIDKSGWFPYDFEKEEKCIEVLYHDQNNSATAVLWKRGQSRRETDNEEFTLRDCDVIEMIYPETIEPAEIQDEDGTTIMCHVCETKPRDIVLLPCTHLYYCKECYVLSQQSRPTQCPTCRGDIERGQPLYRRMLDNLSFKIAAQLPNMFDLHRGVPAGLLVRL